VFPPAFEHRRRARARCREPDDRRAARHRRRSRRLRSELPLHSGAVLVSAFKRIAITRRTPPTTNPPVIEYLVGETFVSMPTEGWTGTGDDCVIWGDPIVVEPEEELVLAPQGDPAEWIETFPLIGYDGTFTEGRENAYYSFYTTAGALSHETRRPPDRDATFTAPEEPGPVRLWLVVRDGHLGARACTFTLTVAAP
jgi:hypothetical protein